MPRIAAASNRIELASAIVSAYVEYNSVPVSELPTLIDLVHDALAGLSRGGEAKAAAEPLRPKVSIRRSVAPDHIVCLEDGRRFKSLKRHLQAEHGLSPEAYRARWGLAKDYPMVAPAYADARSKLARSMSLGRRTSGDELSSSPPALRQPGPSGSGEQDA